MEDNGRWFVFRVKTGTELKIKEWFDSYKKENKDITEEEKRVIDVMVPTQPVYKIIKGKSVREVKPKMPGYILIKITTGENEIIDIEKSIIQFFSPCRFFLSFIATEGTRRNQMRTIRPLTRLEEEKIIKHSTDTATNEEADITNYIIGEEVKIVDGPFYGFQGKIISLNNKNNTAKVSVVFFSRDMEVEINISQLSKI